MVFLNKLYLRKTHDRGEACAALTIYFAYPGGIDAIYRARVILIERLDRAERDAHTCTRLHTTRLTHTTDDSVSCVTLSSVETERTGEECVSRQIHRACVAVF